MQKEEASITVGALQYLFCVINSTWRFICSGFYAHKYIFTETTDPCQNFCECWQQLSWWPTVCFAFGDVKPVFVKVMLCFFLIFFSTCSASLVSYIDPKSRPTLSDVMITLKDVVHDSWCRLYYSNTIFKMFYLKCETLSTGGKKIAAWDWPSSSVRVSICVCLQRCLFYYKPLRHRIWVILNMSVFVCLVRGLFKSLCAFHYVCLFPLFVQ